MQKEMSEFVQERIKIEEEIAKNLAKLSQNSLAAQEEGSPGEGWVQVKNSLAGEAEVHLRLSTKLHREIKKPLMNFHEDFKKDMKKCDHHITDLRKQLSSHYALPGQSKWFEEMVTTTLQLERLEVERVEMIQQHLCQYTQLQHETNMFHQSTLQPIDQLLQKVDPVKDRELWVREHKTGNICSVDVEIYT
ncbi:Growth arrest-specific protein 7 [Sciurus carolinensis]|uniref:Growth arrest-specific protein 7 n=1 Tax=Sciurus carolinensis TaxID=30640 RepID=A0AA41SZZ8_SCICA|nr:Growth arrest-specific protein 7 [Sciurus carolinensis]